MTIDINDVWFVIPARKGSKRLPLKNRELVPIVLENLLPGWLDRTIVSTDDPEISTYAKGKGATIHKRSRHTSGDKVSMRSVMAEVVDDLELKDHAWVVCLYPTYPERKSSDILAGIDLLKKSKSSSMLCKKPIKTHPYMCLYAAGKNRGWQVIENDLYRWQDFPESFEYCHFMSIFQVGELNFLNSQLFNEETIFYNIADPIDVDTPNDLAKYYNKDHEVRPWGEFFVLSDSNDCKVKRISVKPGGRLSYQYHHKREEIWTFISGNGVVVLDDKDTNVSAGDIIHIPIGHKHRIENTGNENLDFIEVQLGTYFGEDDIVRLNDDYGRVKNDE